MNVLEKICYIYILYIDIYREGRSGHGEMYTIDRQGSYGFTIDGAKKIQRLKPSFAN